MNISEVTLSFSPTLSDFAIASTYLKVPPGTKLTEEDIKALGQKNPDLRDVQPKLFTQDYDIKRKAEQLKPGIVVPHVSDPNSSAVLPKDIQTIISDKYYDAVSSTHYKMQTKALAEFGYETPGLRPSDLLQYNNLAISSKVYNIMNRTYNHKKASSRSDIVPMLPEGIATEILARELLTLPGVVPQLACLLRILCGKGKAGFNAAIQVLKNYLLSATGHTEGNMNKVAATCDFRHFACSGLELLPLSHMPEAISWAQLRPRAVDLASYDVHDRSLRDSTCFPSYRMNNSLLSPDAMGAYYNTNESLRAGDLRTDVRALLPYSGITLTRSLELNRAIAALKAVTLCPAKTSDVLNAIIWERADRDDLSTICTGNFKSYSMLNNLPLAYIPRLHVIMAALSQPGIDVRKIFETPFFRVSGTSPTTVLSQLETLLQVSSNLTQSMHMMGREALNFIIKAPQCFPKGIKIEARGLLGTEMFQYPWAVDGNKTSFVSWLPSDVMRNLTLWIDSGTTDLLQSYGIYPSLLQIPHTLALADTTGNASLNSMLLAILLRPIKYLALGNDDFTNIYWDLWKILANAPTITKLLEYNQEYTQALHKKYPSRAAFWAPKAIEEVLNDTTQEVDFEYLEKGYGKDLQKVLKTSVSKTLKKFNCATALFSPLDSTAYVQVPPVKSLYTLLFGDQKRDDLTTFGFSLWQTFASNGCKEYTPAYDPETSYKVWTEMPFTSVGNSYRWTNSLPTAIAYNNTMPRWGLMGLAERVFDWNYTDWDNLMGLNMLLSSQKSTKKADKYVLANIGVGAQLRKLFVSSLLPWKTNESIQATVLTDYRGKGFPLLQAENIFTPYDYGTYSQVSKSFSRKEVHKTPLPVSLADTEGMKKYLENAKDNYTVVDLLFKLGVATGVQFLNKPCWDFNAVDAGTWNGPENQEYVVQSIADKRGLKAIIKYLKYFWDTHENISIKQLIQEAKRRSIKSQNITKLIFLCTEANSYEELQNNLINYDATIQERFHTWASRVRATLEQRGYTKAIVPELNDFCKFYKDRAGISGASIPNGPAYYVEPEVLGKLYAERFPEWQVLTSATSLGKDGRPKNLRWNHAAKACVIMALHGYFPIFTKMKNTEVLLLAGWANTNKANPRSRKDLFVSDSCK